MGGRKPVRHAIGRVIGLSAALALTWPATGAAARSLQSALTRATVRRVVLTATTSLPSLNTVAFATAQAGWAGGARAILGTENGGRTWKTEWHGPATVSQVAAPSRSVAFALTNHGSLMRTTDRGRRWHVVHTPLVARSAPCADCLTSMTWPSPRAGYLIYARGSSPTGALGPAVAGVAGILYRTRDGGLTWQRVPTPEPVQSVCFTAPARGFAANGTNVYGTDDGGRSWHRIYRAPLRPQPPPMVASLACAGNAVALEITGGEGGMEHYPYIVFASDDGGLQWHPAMEENYTHPGAAGVNAPQGPGTEPELLTMTPHGTPVVAGFLPQFGASAIAYPVSGRLSVYQTEGIEAFAALSFPTRRDGWGVTSGIGGGRLVHTVNGAATWVDVYPTGPAPLYAIAFATRRLGFGLGTVGGPQAVLRTTDGGHKWRVVAQLRLGYDRYGDASLAFSTASRGVAAGPAGDYMTDDGGRTWTRIALDGASRVAFDGRIGCAVGRPSDTLISRDGGRSWRRVGQPLPAGISARACVASETDATWRRIVQALGDQGSLVGADGSRTAWILVGDRLYRTHNGGRSWTAFSSPTLLGGGQVLDSAFPTATVGYLLTPLGVFSTTDGGSRWTPRS